MKQEIAFSRGCIVLPEGTVGQGNKTWALSTAAEIARLGYVVDMPAIDRLSTLSANQLRAVTTELIEIMKGKLGATRAFKPFYVNFPGDVMEMAIQEMFLNAIIHYCSCGRWEPAQELKRRGPLTETVTMAPLRFITESQFRDIFTDLAGSAQSLSPFNKRAVEWFVSHYDKSDLRMPAKVPFRETLALLATLGCDVPVRFETDVLRIALALSGVDPAILPVPAKGDADRIKHRFKKFSRPERKYLLRLLESTEPRAEELQVHKDRWIRLGEILHVGEYAGQFPLSYQAFRAIRSQGKKGEPKVRTWASNFDYAMKRGDGHSAMALLCSRPGEFARKLDLLLRTFNQHDVLTSFSTIVDRVSSKVQLEVIEHLMNRAQDTSRTIVAKGARKATSLEVLAALPEDVVERGVGILLAAMSHGIAKLPKMGKVYLDPELKRMSLVKGARTQSDGARTVPRGTRMKFDENCNVIRGFVHWFDEHGSEDIDLSVSLYSGDFGLIEQVSFTNLKTSGVYHSGDIRYRQGSCAEYIDIDIGIALKKGIRYAALVCYNFQRRPMNSMKECFVGYMGRNSPESGEIFEPRTVKNALIPESKETSVMPCVFDLAKREMIWLDMDITGHYLGGGSDNQISTNMKMYAEEPNLSMLDLLTMHVAARRGTLVDDPAMADEVYTYDQLSLDSAKAATFATW